MAYVSIRRITDNLQQDDGLNFAHHNYNVGPGQTIVYDGQGLNTSFYVHGTPRLDHIPDAHLEITHGSPTNTLHPFVGEIRLGPQAEVTLDDFKCQSYSYNATTHEALLWNSNQVAFTMHIDTGGRTLWAMQFGSNLELTTAPPSPGGGLHYGVAYHV